MEPANTQLNTPDPIMIPPKSSSKNWIIIGIVIVLVLGTGIYYYQSTKGGTKTMDTQETAFNDKAHTILTKDFTYPSEKQATMYGVVQQMGGSLAYRLFINDTLIDSGQPKFGSAGSVPLDTSLFKTGINTLRLEVDPHPETGEFDKNSSCDIAVIAANEGDIASTKIEENNNILAQVTCPTLVEQRDPSLLPEPSDSEKNAVIEAYDQFKSLVESKDIELLTQYAGAIEDTILVDGLSDTNKNRDILLNTMISNFAFANVDQLKKSTTIWEKSTTDKMIISFKVPLPEEKKEKGVENFEVYFKLLGTEWFWIGYRVGGDYIGVASR
jgi:hypothetical protein